METDLNFWLQLFTVAFCIGLGGRYGGVGLGAAGGLGVCILVLFFGLKPSSPPVSTILIIVAVIACTSILQGAGGLDWMVKIAERMLRRWPKAITFVAPFVCSFFVIFVGTAYVAFAVYPVVAEVATQARVRPERPIAASVISAGIAVVASPMSAATAALVASLSPYNVSLLDILMISVPAFIIATAATCLSVYWRGTELEDDLDSSAALPRATLRIWFSRARTTKMRNHRASIRCVSRSPFSRWVWRLCCSWAFSKGFCRHGRRLTAVPARCRSRRLFRW